MLGKSVKKVFSIGLAAIMMMAAISGCGKTKQGVENNAQSQKLIRAAVTACVEDPDAMEVVKANI